ncbi:MAG: HigA family addiction module antitoxin [Terracidiphilus sp.]|jgi:addiction module HigA family antidote
MIFNPAHPGEVLRDYLGEMSVADAASRLGLTRAHLSRILNGHAGITANTSLRLSAALGTSADFWLKMQMQHDLWLEQQQPSRFKVRPFPQRSPWKAPEIGSTAHRPLRDVRTQRPSKEMALSAAAGS